MHTLQALQNMDYVIYTYYKTKNAFFIIFTNLFKNKTKTCWRVQSILYNKSLFWTSYSDSVYLTVYGNMV